MLSFAVVQDELTSTGANDVVLQAMIVALRSAIVAGVSLSRAIWQQVKAPSLHFAFRRPSVPRDRGVSPLGVQMSVSQRRISGSVTRTQTSESTAQTGKGT